MHPLATQAGMELLQRGASAMEATVAIGAVLGVVWPHLSGLGGDAFFLVFDGEKVRALIANGFTGDRIRAGKEPIPDHGPGAVLSVPGVVSGWQALLNGAPFTPELLDPAIRLAEQGAPIDDSLQRWMRADNEPEWRDVMANCEGGVFKQPQLVETLRLMSQGRDFYCCKISGCLCETLLELGIPMDKSDFHFQHVEWIAPAHHVRDDCEIWSMPLDEPVPDEGDGVVAFTVVDDQGRAVSARQTLHRPWGSGMCCPRTGILLQHGGRAFSSDPSQPGALAPRQRPPVSCGPVLVARGGKFLLPGKKQGGLIEAACKHPVCATADRSPS